MTDISESTDLYRAGAEAMRDVAAKFVDEYTDGGLLADAIRALPIPGRE